MNPVTLVVIVLANALTLYAAVPYMRETAQGKTKPRVASWFGWGALTVVGAASAYQQHQVPAAIFLTVVTLQNFAIVALGLKHGDRRLSVLEIFCLAGAFIGGASLFLLKSPVISTWVAIVTDFVVLIPTLKHTWQQPGEETASTYVLESIAAILTLTLANGFAFTAIAYPLYLLISEEVLAVLIFHAHRRQQFDLIMASASDAENPPSNPGQS